MTVKIEGIKSQKQKTNYTCGPASLRTIFYFYGKSISERELVKVGNIGIEGTDFPTMKKLARKYGFSFYSQENGHLKLIEKYLESNIPVLVCYQDYGVANGKNGHYAVITGINKDWIEIADPSNYFEGDYQRFAEKKRMRKDIFLGRWFEDEYDYRFKRWFAIIKPTRKQRSK